jgi:hypothetical protein
MEQIAMLQSGEDPAETTIWGEHITDDVQRLLNSAPYCGIPGGQGRSAPPAYQSWFHI